MIIPVSVVKEATLASISAGWGFDQKRVDELTSRSIGEIASDVRATIEAQLLRDVFAIEPILLQTLKRNEEHARAIDALLKEKELNGSDVAISHIRLLEESFTTATFLISQPDRYEEFGWRWSAYPTIHAIRNRLFGLGQQLSEDMISWIKAHEKQLVWMDEKGRLTADMSNPKVRGQWEKCSNWLVPATIKDIFEKAGRLDSYKKKGYDMGSQSVHLSPMGDIYMSYELPHHDYATFMLENGVYFVIKILSLFCDLVKDNTLLRKNHALENILQTYSLLASNPARFGDLVARNPGYAAFVSVVMSTPNDVDALINAVIGKPSQSCLELQLDSVEA